MSQLSLVLNRQDPDYEQIATAIRKNLGALKSVAFEEKREPQQPGTLSVEWHHVVSFGLSQPIIASSILRALIELGKMVLAAKKRPADPKQPPIIIVLDGKELPLPSSDQKIKHYLKSFEQKGREDDQYGEKTSNAVSTKVAPRKLKKKARKKK